MQRLCRRDRSQSLLTALVSCGKRKLTSLCLPCRVELTETELSLRSVPNLAISFSHIEKLRFNRFLFGKGFFIDHTDPDAPPIVWIQFSKIELARRFVAAMLEKGISVTCRSDSDRGRFL